MPLYQLLPDGPSSLAIAYCDSVLAFPVAFNIRDRGAGDVFHVCKGSGDRFETQTLCKLVDR
jgi:hypothetical protein